MLGVGLTGCDGHHDPLDTSMKVGHILCTDGKTRSHEDYVASGKEAIAVVFHVNRNEEMSGTGYAICMTFLRKPLLTVWAFRKERLLT